jgi:hypothetical protein
VLTPPPEALIERRLAVLSRVVLGLRGEVRAMRSEIRARNGHAGIPVRSEIVDAKEIARLIGRSPDYVRKHFAVLGGWREDGPGSRLRFDRDLTVARYRRGLGEAK